MIFVTVGTHEQGFDRLVKKIDFLIRDNILTEEVIIQKGYTSYQPEHCKCYDFLPYEEMQKYQEEARLIITHGGPASFLYPLSISKIPIVVPRQKSFNEHINDHQLDFSRKMVEKKMPIIVVEDVEDLMTKIQNYDEIIHNLDQSISFNNQSFVDRFTEEVKNLFRKEI
ncbi:MAG: hypothetical protein K2I77_06385 [Anaeroplasmataceae bacterium]|nr:hypothetical protein [Anaeroplasmataceae bacterium]